MAVAPLVSGRIVALPVDEGDAVESGDAVAVIDSTDYVLRRNEARAAVAQARARLDLTVLGARRRHPGGPGPRP